MVPIQIYAKAKAFVDTLSKLSSSQYAAVPTGNYARDYNVLRELALEVRPSIDERLLGPIVSIATLPDGPEVCGASFAEIETYARQIMEQFGLPESHPTSETDPDLPVVSPEPPAKAYTVEEKRKENPNAYERWTKSADQNLRELFNAGSTVKTLMAEFGRNEGAIRSRLKKLGLTS